MTEKTYIHPAAHPSPVFYSRPLVSALDNLIVQQTRYKEILDTPHNLFISLPQRQIIVPAQRYGNDFFACICENLHYQPDDKRRMVVDEEVYRLVSQMIVIPETRRWIFGIERIDLVWPSPYHSPLIPGSKKSDPYFIAGLLIETDWKPPEPSMQTEKGLWLEHGYYGFADKCAVEDAFNLAFDLRPLEVIPYDK